MSMFCRTSRDSSCTNRRTMCSRCGNIRTPACMGQMLSANNRGKTLTRLKKARSHRNLTRCRRVVRPNTKLSRFRFLLIIPRANSKTCRTCSQLFRPRTTWSCQVRPAFVARYRHRWCRILLAVIPCRAPLSRNLFPVGRQLTPPVLPSNKLKRNRVS